MRQQRNGQTGTVRRLRRLALSGLVLLGLLLAAFALAYAAKQSKLEGVLLTQDLVYSRAGKHKLLLDAYQPDPLPKAAAPVVVYIHGGGWEFGSKDEGLDMLSALARHGYVCFSIDYRLTTLTRWPAQIHDCKAALRWVHRNATKYGGDPSRIGVMGASAGGHLAAMIGLTAGEPTLAGNLPPANAADNVQAVCDWFGPANLMDENKFPPDSQRLVSGLLGLPPTQNPGPAREASPVNYVDAKDPPFLIIHGDKDPIVPVEQSRELAAALKAAGVSCDLVEVPGGEHGSFTQTSPNGVELATRMIAFFDEKLGHTPPPAP